MPPAARITDMTACPMVTPGLPPIPHVGGPIAGPCSPNVLIGGLLAARVTDMTICVGPPATIIMGSMTVLINGLQAARIGDPTNHGGAIVIGMPTVMIGDMGSGSPGDFGGANAADFAASLREAALDGKPFCEVCYQQAVERAAIKG